MNVMTRRVVLDADNPLFEKIHPALLQIFCCGVKAVETKQLMLGAIISLVLAPFGWVALILGKAVHIAIVLTAWWLLRGFISEFGSLDYVLLAVGLIAIFYEDIHDELLNLFMFILVLVTGGGFLRWVCTGYLTGAAFRQKILTTKPMQFLIGQMVGVIPNPYRSRYEQTKRKLAEQSWECMDDYAKEKTEVVESIITAASSESENHSCP